MLRPFRWQNIADELPSQLKRAAEIFGSERVVLAGFRTLGYPASWATSGAEFHKILDELEKDDGH